MTVVLLGGCAANDPADATPPTRPGDAHDGPADVTGPGRPDRAAPGDDELSDGAWGARSPQPDVSVAAEGERAADPRRPAWLGTRELALRADGFGQVLPTPDELVDRRLPPPPGGLPDPPADAPFSADVQPVPAEVLARSTWHDGCPVTADELRYVTVSFWGFDGRAHRGELLVHRDAAATIVDVFAAAFDARFPIEQMRIVHPDELDLAPTGDGNNTTAFVCRATRGSGSWSQHAYGRAVDVNPFHNPYVRDDLVLPELASAYLDRHDLRPGMVVGSGPVVAGFDRNGWGWGGRWTRPVDYMHFSATGR